MALELGGGRRVGILEDLNWRCYTDTHPVIAMHSKLPFSILRERRGAWMNNQLLWCTSGYEGVYMMSESEPTMRKLQVNGP